MAQTQIRGTQLLDESVNFAVDIDVPVVVKSTTYTLTNADTNVLCDTTSAGFTVTLPTAIPPSSTQKNGPYRIKNVGVNPLTIQTTSSQTIDGNASPLILSYQNSSVDLISDGTNWWIN